MLCAITFTINYSVQNMPVLYNNWCYGQGTYVISHNFCFIVSFFLDFCKMLQSLFSLFDQSVSVDDFLKEIVFFLLFFFLNCFPTAFILKTTYWVALSLQPIALCVSTNNDENMELSYIT